MDEIYDDYGNTEDDPFQYCTFPHCGCDGARLCQAKEGTNYVSQNLNFEKGNNHRIKLNQERYRKETRQLALESKQ